MADIFVDQSATYNGDGTSAAQAVGAGQAGAYNTFASVVPSANDKVWIRRTASVVLLTAGQTLSAAGVAYIGWPKTGDPDYAARPASGTANGWDADSATYAELKTTTVVTVSFFIVTGSGTRMERLKLNENFTSGTNNKATLDVQTDMTLNNCWMLYSGTVNVSVNHSVLISNAGSPILKATGTVFEYSGPLTSNTANALFWVLAAGDWEFIGCTFTMSKTGESNSNVKLVYGGSGSPTISFASCQFTRVGQGTATLLDFAQFSTSSVVAMYDCTITDASASAATQLSTNQGLFIGQRIGMAAGRRVALNTAGQYIHFSKLTQTVASSDYCVVLTAGCTFVANNFTEAAGNTSGAINGTVACNILLANTSFQSANPFGVAASQQASIWIADAGGTYGNWQFIGRRGTISAQAVNRTGGESYSLKFNMTSGNRNFLGCLQGFLNGLETILASVTTASTSIVLYGAYKGYSPAPDASQIWADCDYLDQASGSRRAFASSRGNPGVALTADSSTWNGDTGLTPFKLVIPVAALQNCLAPIRIFGNLRQASAYFYIDPKPEVA